MTDASDPSDPTTQPSLVFDAKAHEHSLPEDVLGLLTGTFLASLGLYLLQGSGAVTGGTAGLSLLLSYVTPLSVSVLFFVVNVPFVVLAIWQKGWNFTIRTLICVSLVSVFSSVHGAYLHFADIQPFYAVLAGNLLAGVGVLILFRHRASVGGVNILGLVIQDRTGFGVGWTSMIFDTLIIALSLFALPWPTVLMSIAGAVLLNLVLALNHRPGRYLGH